MCPSGQPEGGPDSCGAQQQLVDQQIERGSRMVHDFSGTNADGQRHVLDGFDDESAIQRIGVIDLHRPIRTRRGERSRRDTQFGDQGVRAIRARARPGERRLLWHDRHRIPDGLVSTRAPIFAGCHRRLDRATLRYAPAAFEVTIQEPASARPTHFVSRRESSRAVSAERMRARSAVSSSTFAIYLSV